ncbi:hypothetical protein OG618_22685 [Kitasatospora sp. NBC_01246]|uniref:hypothetical protein n=1 Tax=Kitasatospora sp. NBC_01246 TaxID=2903570 RepID=UPI002E367638|nr:hypothetical protein [Kitasatospora sp. NBC_01246]
MSAAPVRRWLTRHRDAPAPAVLHEAGPHFVIAPGAAHGAAHGAAAAPALPAELAAALAALPSVVGTVTVLAAAADAQPVLLASLAELARTAAVRRAGILVLAASGLATAQPDGRRPAQRIAELAATGIVAPDGVVTLRPDGTLLADGTGPGSPASWWLFTPAGPARRLGPVWPLPETADVTAARAWAADPAEPRTPRPGSAGPAPRAASAPAVPAAGTPVPAATAPQAPPPAPAPMAGDERDPLGGGPLVTELPGGYWLHGESAPDVRSGPLDLATAAPGTLVLVVGDPGAPLPAAAGVAERLARVRPAPAELLVSAPWAATAALVALTAALAAELGRDVRAAVGLPMRTADGCSARVLAADGTPGWEPWLTELTASPGRGRVVASAWRPLPDGTPPDGPALYRAPVAGWRLEAVPAGLWLRPDEPPRDHGPRLLDPGPDRPLLIVGSADRTVPAEVLAVVDGLLTALTVPGAAVPGLLLNGPTRAPAPLTAPATEAATDAGLPAPPRPTATSTGPSPAPGPAGQDPDGTDAPGPEAGPALVPAETGPESTGSPGPDTEPTVILPTTSDYAAEPTTAPGGAGDGDSDSDDTAEVPAVPRLIAPDGAFSSGRPSTAAERAAFRALLGPHFHRYASQAEQVALRLPALRSQPRDDLKDDLAAVYLHHADTGIPASRAELVAAARRPGGPGSLELYLACLGSGLRRLPNHRGAVLLGSDAGEEVLRHYVRGALLTEPAPVVGTPEADLAPGTSTEFLVWSATGRRTSVIADDGDPEVVFPPGSRFRVLDVLPGGEDRPVRVLLREAAPGPAATGPAADAAAEEHDAQARTRLLAWQDRRDLLPPARLRPPARPERLRLTPGVAAG